MLTKATAAWTFWNALSTIYKSYEEKDFNEGKYHLMFAFNFVDTDVTTSQI